MPPATRSASATASPIRWAWCVDNKGSVTDVTWGGPAFKAGIALGTQIIAVDGDDYDADGLKDAITDAKGNQTPITLLIKRNDAYRTISIPYHEGLRYPHLERVPNTPALLDALIAAKNRRITRLRVQARGSASASRSTAMPAPSRMACSLRWRRKARAPGWPLNRPSMCRVMLERRTPSFSLRST